MRFIVMSDLHLAKKPWQVRKAFCMGKDADAVLLAGDSVNDGTPAQLLKLQQCVSEVLADVPVLAVAGNHDYPHQPLPLVRDGVYDYPALQDWLLERQKHPYTIDPSGAWAVQIGDTAVIGLNCVSHWRRFKFEGGEQLSWLEAYLRTSSAARRVILCHAPLLAHNPKRSDTKPYLSRDEQLQRILDEQGNVIFISGHTHASMRSPTSCVDWDAERGNLYINDGSIRPTTLLKPDGRPEADSVEGNVVELLLEGDAVTVTAYAVNDGSLIRAWEIDMKQ